MPLLPSRSRDRLSWNIFKKTDSGDHLLVLPPFYARLFVAHFPNLMRYSSAGFQDTKTGNNKRAFFRRLADGDSEKIEKFIGYYQTKW